MRVEIDGIDCDGDLIEKYRQDCKRITGVYPISGGIGWIKAVAILIEKITKLEASLAKQTEALDCGRALLETALASVQDENMDLEAALAAQAEEIERLKEQRTRFAEVISQSGKELLRLEAIVDRLRKTRDGVPITPNMELWYIHPRGPVYRWKGQPGHATSHYDDEGGVHWIRETDCYSTRETAEAAKGERDG